MFQNSNQPKKVIIIDQSLFMRTTIKILLLNKGCDIFEADEESKAVTMTVNKKPTFILMSLGFAKQNKMRFVKTLKNLHRCPVIIYSNVVTREDIAASFIASADDLILRPLQQGDRLIRYLLLSPVDIRRYYLNGPEVKELQFNQSQDWNTESHPPVREGGNINWDLEAV